MLTIYRIYHSIASLKQKKLEIEGYLYILLLFAIMNSNRGNTIWN